MNIRITLLSYFALLAMASWGFGKATGFICGRGGITSQPSWYENMWKCDSTDAPGLLFDLSTDLGQRNNLYDHYPERAHRMEARLAEILKGNLK